MIHTCASAVINKFISNICTCALTILDHVHIPQEHHIRKKYHHQGKETREGQVHQGKERGQLHQEKESGQGHQNERGS